VDNLYYKFNVLEEEFKLLPQNKQDFIILHDVTTIVRLERQVFKSVVFGLALFCAILL
jgi:hypothetical protein